MSEPDLPEVMRERRRLINLAYRMLGTVSDAEDAVQETYARWYALPASEQEGIRSPGAWLTTVASRICLDQLGSARARRERYVGEWLPEPVPDPDDRSALDPADRITLDESIDMAFLVVLDEMTPAERVCFLLHDVFGYAFDEIAAIVGRTPAACRQLASSARRRVRAADLPAAPPADRAGVVRDFKEAWRANDIAALVNLLDPDVVIRSDGGGLVPAAGGPIEGREFVARFFTAIAERFPSLDAELRTVNGQPGLVGLDDDGEVNTVFAFDIHHGLIRRIWAMRNPEKLRAWMG